MHVRFVTIAAAGAVVVARNDAASAAVSDAFTTAYDAAAGSLPLLRTRPKLVLSALGAAASAGAVCWQQHLRRTSLARAAALQACVRIVKPQPVATVAAVVDSIFSRHDSIDTVRRRRIVSYVALPCILTYLLFLSLSAATAPSTRCGLAGALLLASMQGSFGCLPCILFWPFLPLCAGPASTAPSTRRASAGALYLPTMQGNFCYLPCIVCWFRIHGAPSAFP